MEYRQADSDQERSDCLRRFLSYENSELRRYADQLSRPAREAAFADHAPLRARAIRLLRALGYDVVVDSTYIQALSEPDTE